MSEAQVIPVTPAQIQAKAAAAQAPAAPAAAPSAPAADATVVPPAAPTAPAAASTDMVAMLKEALESAKATAPAPQLPQVPVDPKAAPAAEAAAPTGLNALTEDDISDPQVRSLGGLLRSVAPGVDIDRVLGKAIDKGDPSLVDTAYLQEAFPQQAAQLKDLAERIVVAAEAEVKSTVAAIHQQSGGEAAWNAAAAAFNQHAAKEIKAVVADLLNSPNHTKVKQGASFILEFAKQGGHISTPAQLLTGAPSAGQAPTDPALAPLNERSFKQELIKMRANSALDPYSPEYKEARNILMYRRHLGKQRGA